MNKFWLWIALAFCIITGVMTYLLIKGVYHREHTFIKWSKIESAEQMGVVSMRRLFPLLQKAKAVNISSESPITNDFAEGFKKGLGENNLSVEVTVDNQPHELNDELFIEIKRITTDKVPGSCAEKSRDECIAIKATRDWQKKERSKDSYWFLLQWVAKDHFHLYYTPPVTVGQ